MAIRIITRRETAVPKVTVPCGCIGCKREFKGEREGLVLRRWARHLRKVHNRFAPATTSLEAQ